MVRVPRPTKIPWDTTNLAPWDKSPRKYVILRMRQYTEVWKCGDTEIWRGEETEIRRYGKTGRGKHSFIRRNRFSVRVRSIPLVNRKL